MQALNSMAEYSMQQCDMVDLRIKVPPMQFWAHASKQQVLTLQKCSYPQ